MFLVCQLGFSDFLPPWVNLVAWILPKRSTVDSIWFHSKGNRTWSVHTARLNQRSWLIGPAGFGQCIGPFAKIEEFKLSAEQLQTLMISNVETIQRRNKMKQLDPNALRVHFYHLLSTGTFSVQNPVEQTLAFGGWVKAPIALCCHLCCSALWDICSAILWPAMRSCTLTGQKRRQFGPSVTLTCTFVSNYSTSFHVAKERRN